MNYLYVSKTNNEKSSNTEMNNHIIIIYHYIYDIIQYMIIICLEMVLPAKCSRRIWHQHQDVLGLVLGAREVPGQLSNQSSTR